MTSRPLALSMLGGLQFAAAGIACVVILGESTLDGALSGTDIALAVGVAVVGALVVGSTWNGGRLAFWFEVVLALAAMVVGGLAAVDEDVWGLPLAGAGLLSLAIAVLPQSRAWFLRPQL